MFASTGDPQVKARLDYVVAELKRAQAANGDGYLGGIPGGRAAWRDVAAGKRPADNFSVNGKWVPWYNLHKVYAGLRDAYRYAGNAIYRIDPETAAITSIAALMTGGDFVVGQPVPVGYPVYNVPYPYRDRYVDGPDGYYRYADGYVYRVDPETRLVAAAIELLVS